MSRRPAHRASAWPRRRLTMIRAAFGLVALGAASALVVQALPAPASAADDSSLTVAWTGDTGSAARYQPTRSTSSPHYSPMKDIKVTVAQTKNLIDQAVRVTLSGFSPTVSYPDYLSYTPANAANFVQAMQCWGDPSASDFYRQCQWGGLFGANSGVGSLVESDTLLRVDSSNLRGTGAADPLTDPKDVPFRSIDGTVVSGRQQVKTQNSVTTTTYPLFSLFTPTSTNEVPGARIDANGTGTFDFETQNSDTAPQLGCGTSQNLRCWLVVVPRDDVWGGGKPGRPGTCSPLLDDRFATPAYGSTGTPQAGSPVNPACDYWDNRIVVPLDFTPTGVTCPKGTTERRTVGSDLLVGAMASWQPQLCLDTKTNFSFTTGPDLLARSQLMQGTVGMIFTPGPLASAELSDGDAATLAKTALSYAPVAATSAVVAYNADGTSGRITSLRLSPRLVAKLLTQSYPFTVPVESRDPQADIAHLPAKNRSYVHWNADPEFQALNPNWNEFVADPSVIVPGPYSADVIAQLWKWVTSDADARAWLNGAVDPLSGMTVNPYYRASGDPAAVVPVFGPDGKPVVKAGAPVTKAVGLSTLSGSPLKLGDTALNSFIKADATLVPLNTSGVRYPFGSIQAAPYAQDFVAATRLTFRANPGAKVKWDSSVIDDAGEAGAWVSPGPQIVGQRFTLAFTDAPSASLYDLSTASLSLDNRPTEFADATPAQVSAAVNSPALQPTAHAGVSRVDPSKATSGQYPLAALVYAAVNLTSADTPSRKDFAKLIRQVTTTGQVPGSAVGKLPSGYVPLTPALVAQAATAATAIESFVAPTSPASDGVSSLGDNYPAGSAAALAANGYPSDGSSATTGTGATTGSVSSRPASYTGRTPSAGTPWVMQVALIGGLVGGVLGSLLTPVLFRRRRIT